MYLYICKDTFILGGRQLTFLLHLSCTEMPTGTSDGHPIVRRLRPCRAVCPTATHKHSNQPRIRQGMYKYAPHAEKGQAGCFRVNNEGPPQPRAIWRTLLRRPFDLLVGNSHAPAYGPADSLEHHSPYVGKDRLVRVTVGTSATSRHNHSKLGKLWQGVALPWWCGFSMFAWLMSPCTYPFAWLMSPCKCC